MRWDRLSGALSCLPPETALGALLAHVTGGHLVEPGVRTRSFQPMNINYGLVPDAPDLARRDGGDRRIPPAERGRTKKRTMSERALQAIGGWASSTPARRPVEA